VTRKADPRLVGRKEELRLLAGWVSELADGRGHAALLEGEPGIGKSALLRAAASQAAAAGYAVFSGAGEELGQAFPLLPILHALGIDESSTDPRHADVLRAMGEPHIPPTAAAEIVLDLIDRLCVQSPGILIVDDLHWADEQTVAVFYRLARSTTQRPLLLIGAMRPLPRREDLKRLRRTIDRDSQLRLAPLPPDAVSDLVTGLIGGRPGPGLTQLAAGAAGNPLYLTELLDALDRSGALQLTGGTAEVTAGHAPATLGEAITDRLGFLPRPARDLLQSAALLGGEFSADDLAVVTARRPAELAPALADAQTAGVLIDTGNRLAFRHPLIRAALYDAMAPAARTAWHVDAARALRDANAPAERVARQLVPALVGQLEAPAPVAGWVIEWLVDSAPTLLARTTQVAVDLLEATAGRIQARDIRWAQLNSYVADGLATLGRFEDAARLVERTLPETADRDVFAKLHLTLARCRTHLGQHATSLAEVANALAQPGISERYQRGLRVRLADLLIYAGEIEAAEKAAHEVLESTVDGRDADITCPALIVLAGCRTWLGDELGALGYYERAVAAVDGHAELANLQLRAQSNLGILLVVLDRTEEAEAVLLRAQRLADRTGNASREMQAQVWLAALFLETGRWDDALTAVELSSETQLSYSRCQVEGAGAFIALHRGKAVAARRHLSAAGPYAELLDDAIVVGYLWSARALDHEQSGDPAAALGVLTMPRTARGDVQEVEVFLADAVRLAVTVGDQATAAELTARAEALPSREVIPHRAAIAMHCRGLLDGDPVPIRESADGYAAARRPLPQAQALESAAALLAERGDREAAREPFTAAMDIYAGLGAAWDLARARDRFRRYGLRRPTRRLTRPKTGWEALTAAEAQVAELVAAGLSNPEIAERLVVSRHTVSKHVGQVLAKLQVRSRVELARLAAERA